jgi:plasmid maintenance system killer protein
VIRSFRSRRTALLFAGHRSRSFESIARTSQRKLEALNAAATLVEIVDYH